MFESIIKITTEMGSWNWIGIIQSTASLLTMGIAYIALSTWKHQSKAQKATDFLDELTDSVHEFINLMNAPISMLRVVKIGIDSYTDVAAFSSESRESGVVQYIERNGERDSKRLQEYLSNCEQSVAKVRSLIAKGQVFGLKDYHECREACRILTSQYDGIQGVCIIIGNTYQNWQNEQVQESLETLLLMEVDEIERQIGIQNIQYLDFVKKNYDTIYKNT